VQCSGVEKTNCYEESVHDEVTIIGLDLARTYFKRRPPELMLGDIRRKLSLCKQLVEVHGSTPAFVAMEACASVIIGARSDRRSSRHDIRLNPARPMLKPFVKRQKNDMARLRRQFARRPSRPTMRFLSR